MIAAMYRVIVNVLALHIVLAVPIVIFIDQSLGIIWSVMSVCILVYSMLIAKEVVRPKIMVSAIIMFACGWQIILANSIITGIIPVICATVCVSMVNIYTMKSLGDTQ